MEHESPLALNVRFIDEAGLWCWEVADATSNRVVRGGWPDEWMGYPTREEACAAGLETVDQMLGRGDDDSRVDRLESCQLERRPRAVLGSAG